jgi:hypothetical protein
MVLGSSLGGSPAADAAADAEKAAAKKAAADAAKAEAEAAAKKSALDWIKKNPLTTLSGAALAAYMIKHGITDPAEAAADMLKEGGDGIGSALAAILKQLKWPLIAIFALIILAILYQVISKF